jgi:23S rRNA pseudouridine2605 synthase
LKPATLRTMARKVRLNKYLRDCGLGARRKCETIIEEGKVALNGRVVTDLATLVDPATDEVRVEGRVATPFTERVYIAAHKPRGALVTASDPHGRKTHAQAIPGLPEGLFSVGRLDMDSEGLLLLTNDGKLGFRLAHPRYEIERVYRVRVRGGMGEDALKTLRQGVTLEDGPARPTRVRILRRSPASTTLEVTLREGRKREVRRMMAALGFDVDRLVRIRYGSVDLGRLEPGRWRRLTRDEVRGLRRSVEEAYLMKRKT